jgi:hypothetical protein
MSRLKDQEKVAVEAVARHVSSTWEEGDKGSPDAYLMIAGKRIAVDVMVMDEGASSRGDLKKPRLRFDKVALRLVKDLQLALSPYIPDGEALILTITAPIRLRSMTAGALANMVRDGLASDPVRVDIEDTIHGNQVRARLVQGVSAPTSKVFGFVHNPESDPDLVMRLTQSLLHCIGAAAEKRSPEKFTGDRWLVVTSAERVSDIETYRHVYDQLSISTSFTRILMVLAGGRVETLSG